MSQVLKEKCMDNVPKQTQLNVSTNAPQLTSSPKNGRKLHCKNIWVSYFNHILVVSEFHICCICDTLQISREATNLLNQSVVEKLLPLLN